MLLFVLNQPLCKLSYPKSDLLTVSHELLAAWCTAQQLQPGGIAYHGLDWEMVPLGGVWGSNPAALPGVTLGCQECLLHLRSHYTEPAPLKTGFSLLILLAQSCRAKHTTVQHSALLTARAPTEKHPSDC